MIKTKKDLRYYLECDRVALGKKARNPSLFGDEIWKFQICMRKLDYHINRGGVLKYYYRFMYHRFSIKLGLSIPHNVIGPGLAIVHYGSIVISSNATLGANLRIHSGVNIGANGGETEAATIEDNVYIGPGAKIIGNVKIGCGAVIGANAVVNKDVPQGVTVGGIPAKLISENNSDKHIIKATDIVKKGAINYE